MNKAGLFILILCTAVFCGCKTMEDGLIAGFVIIENKSAYDIGIDNSISKLWSYQEPITTTIASGQKYSFYCSYDGIGSVVSDPSDFVGSKCLITFGNGVSVIHTKRERWNDIAIEHSICEEGSFVLLKKEKLCNTFSYTFTDADYDRAVEWNATHGE